MFSNRLPPYFETNRLTRAVAALSQAGTPIIDLTESNPTAVGFTYPGDLFDALNADHIRRYDPQPLGLRSAREAVAADYARRGARVDPNHVVLSASSSEAYSWLFKLLCNPGDGVLVPQPSYPLFEHLTRLESVHPIPYQLRYHGRWEIDFDTVIEAPAHATVIATGSTTSYPPAWNALGDRLVTNETLFEWTSLPASVAVFGPGVIGLELGQALHRLGVRIKVFGRGGGVGPLSDPELVTEARRVFGAEFYLDTDAHAEVSLEAGQVAVRYRALDGETRTEHFDYLLAATGRSPNVARLGLEHTSVSLDEYGVPLFDRETMQCGSSPIFIAGDVNADVPLLHEAADEGRIAGDNAARFPDVHAGMRRSPLSVVFTDPQIAVIGSGWRGAREVAHVTGRVSFDDQGRARVMQRNRGSLHVYAEIRTGLLLGAEMIGPDAEHLGHLLAWSHQLGLTIGEMLKLPFYHPVVEEGLRTALRDAYAQLDAAAHALRAA